MPVPVLQRTRASATLHGHPSCRGPDIHTELKAWVALLRPGWEWRLSCLVDECRSLCHPGGRALGVRRIAVSAGGDHLGGALNAVKLGREVDLYARHHRSSQSGGVAFTVCRQM
jgi:hypothetical protein